MIAVTIVNLESLDGSFLLIWYSVEGYIKERIFRREVKPLLDVLCRWREAAYERMTSRQ